MLPGAVKRRCALHVATGASFLCSAVHERGHADHRMFRHAYRHAIDRAVVHLGDKRHGAEDITAGERINSIIWNHDRTWKNFDAHRRL